MKIDNEQLDILRRERDRYILKHKWRKALKIIEQMIAIQSSASCYTRHAMILTKLRKYDEAKDSLQKALKLNPDYEKAQRLLDKLNDKSVRVEKVKTKPHSWDKDGVYEKWQQLQEISHTKAIDVDKSFTLGIALSANPKINANFASEKTILYSENQEQEPNAEAEFTVSGKSSSLEKIMRDYPSIEHCAIEKKINSGGMGVIYKGIQKNLQREIALKAIQPRMAKHDYQKEKFISEAMVTAYLDHPNIIPVYDMGVGDNDELLLTMKLIKGGSWHELLHPFTRSQREKADEYDLIAHLEILQNVCNAIAFAHNKGIVHNDLKPANIMVGEFGEVFVMDWGVAVDITTPRASQVRTLHFEDVEFPMGTPSYMPPELAKGKGKKIGPWTDVYLLGGILYEILMGKSPHKAKDIKASIYLSCNEIPEFDDDIPQEIREVCAKALEKSIKRRYQNVSDFKKALQDFLQHRESVIISQQSLELLEHCNENIRESQIVNKTNIERNRIYDDFAKALAGFQQAIKLWSENKDAVSGQFAARFSYATAAIQNRDLGLAEAQALEIEDFLKRQQLIKQIKIAKEKTIRSLRMAKVWRHALVAAVLIIISTLASGIWLINKSHNKTIDARERAEQSSSMAIARAKELEKQKDLNTTQRDNALVNLANIALRKAQENYHEAQETKDSSLYAYCGVYAGLAFEYVRDVPHQKHIKQKSQELIRLALLHSPIIWQTPHIYKWTLNTLSYSKNGKYIASGAEDNTVRLWDTQTGKQIRIFDGHSQGITATVFVNDNTIISASKDKSLRVWNLEQSDSVSVLNGHKEQITCIARSKKRLVSASESGELFLWDLVDNSSILKNIDGKITTIAFVTPHIIAVNQQNNIYLWNWKENNHRLLKGHNKPVTKIIALKNSLLASASEDGIIRLWNLKNNNIDILGSHTDAIYDLDYIANNNQLISIAKDETIALWDIEAKKLVGQFSISSSSYDRIKTNPNGKTFILTGKNASTELWSISAQKKITPKNYTVGSLEQVAFSPTTEILASCTRKVICIWNSKSGEKIVDLHHNEKIIRAIEFTNDGQYLFSAIGQKIIVWNTATWQKQNEILLDEIALSISCSIDGKNIAAAHVSGKLTVWNVKTLSKIFTTQAHDTGITCVKFFSDNRLASASLDKTVKIWKLGQRKPSKILRGHTNIIYSLAFNRQRNLLATSSLDRTIRIWNVKTGKQVKSLLVNNVASKLDFAPHGKTIAFGCYDYNNTIKIYDINLGERIRTLKGHNSQVHCVRYNKDGSILASCSNDNSVKMWRVSDHKKFRVLKAHKNGIVHLSNFGKTLISTSIDKQIISWDIGKGKTLRTFPGQKDLILKTAQSSNGSTIATISTSGRVNVWSVHSGSLLTSFVNKQWNFRTITFTPDNKYIVLSTHKNILQIVNIKNGKIKRSLRRHKDKISTVSFNSDGSMLASAGHDGIICLWRYKTGEHIKTFSGHRDVINQIVFSSDNQSMISVSDDETIRIWNLQSGQQQYSLTGHTEAVSSVTYLSKNVIATASIDKTIRLWNLNTQKTLRILRGHKNAVTSLVYIKELDVLASASFDTTIRLWDMKIEKPNTKNLTIHNKNTIKFYDTVIGEEIYVTRDIRIFEHFLDCSIHFRQKIPQWLFELYLEKKTQKLTESIFGYKVNNELAIEKLKPIHLWQYKIE
ncbi:protein kinase [Candidatus Uabimicrobium sp. HlEnr_7]|uniref:protein kinase domain-containing protein n=1 Tax=Candidatus Uabimicrobium helgolandensis TaxID=3095367 RepID=UPI003556850F